MQEKETSLKSRKALWGELYLTFAGIGAVTFGGGYAMLPILERELTEKRDWATEDELLDYYAIGQSTPGIIAVNTATFVGYKNGGVLGGLAATLGMVTPALIIITLIASLLGRFNEIPLVRKALEGVNIAVAVLLLSSLRKFARKTVTGLLPGLLCAAAYLAVGFLGFSPITVVFASAGIGLLSFLVSGRKS